MGRRWPSALAALAAVAAALGVSPLRAQSLEPRSYSNAPLGTSFLISGIVVTEGGLSIDPTLPLTDPKLETWSGVLGYARFINLWGKSGKFDVIAPYTFLSGTARYLGAPIERKISGFADPAFRLSINFVGAPALTAEEFQRYRQNLIFGASVQVTAPAGQYDPTRLVNVGMSRWTLKPEVGISKARRAWTLELTQSATFFTDNRHFYGATREQKPLYSTQAHVIYNFPRGRWASFDVNYFTGGQTTVGGKVKDDLQKNWRLGATYAFPLRAQDSIKLYASSGVSARTGNNFDVLGIAWQHRWGGGTRSGGTRSR